MKLLQSTWVVALLGCVAFLATMYAVFPKAGVLPPQQHTVAQEAEPIDKEAFSLQGHNPEVDQLIAELKSSRTELAEREKRLKELEERLRGERGEFSDATQRVFQLQKQVDQSVVEFEKSIVRVQEEETANLKKLAKMYASMSIESATTILKEMTDDQLAKLLAFMKESDVVAILENFAKGGKDDVKRVVQLSEKMRVTVTRAPGEKGKTP
ncbi:MAG: hypothetical protein HY043_13335 [Verrucomicrobia bacterium]|nr:hypothetical protein [Verrucomicrobiota bacterium]